MAMENTLIRVENLCKHYDTSNGRLDVLKGINTNINAGDVIAIVGPSGGGKSTFLRCLNRLETPNSGHIYFKNVDLMAKETDINKLRSKISMVFQHFNLFANKNVMSNLTLAPITLGLMGVQEAQARAREILAKVGLSDKEDFMPHKLSGGQKQRIAIARSLMMNPDVILFDEPTSALDPEMIGEVLAIIKEVANEGMSMVLVTHEMGFARQVAKRVFFMEGGLIAVDAPPSEVFKGGLNARLDEFLQKVLNH